MKNAEITITNGFNNPSNSSYILLSIVVHQGEIDEGDMIIIDEENSIRIEKIETVFFNRKILYVMRSNVKGHKVYLWYNKKIRVG